MTPGELVMYSILRGGEPPVEVILPCSATRIQTVAPAYIGCKQRLAHLIETGAWEHLQEQA